MCNKDTPLALKQSDGKPARKTRTRTRRPRFLSLRLELKPENHSDPDHHSGSQLNLFPLHPAAASGAVATQPDEDDDDHKDVPDPDTVAAGFFHPDGGATLADLLADSSSPSPPTTTTLTYAYPSAEAAAQVSGSLAGSLVRTAMRNRERDASEERWVRYSEVVEKRELEEVSSCSAGARYEPGPGRRMSLKLDYDEVMNAWRDRGPPYVDGPEGSRTVPDVDDESPPQDDAGDTVWMDGHGDSWGTAGYDGGFCTVPEIQKQSSSMEAIVVGRSVGDDPQGYCLKTGAQREASIQRYKEKRQARLFSKRIRYHVRKLNAEKRPRIKGRFVKRI